MPCLSSSINNLYIILFAAWRRRYLLVIPVLVMPLVGVAIGLLTPKEYESRTTFMVPQDANQTPTLKDLITQESLKDRFAVLNPAAQPLCTGRGGAGSRSGQ